MEQAQTKQDKRTGQRKLVVKTASNGMKYIGYEAGGVTPKELQGVYTSTDHAKQAIMFYEAK